MLPRTLAILAFTGATLVPGSYALADDDEGVPPQRSMRRMNSSSPRDGGSMGGRRER